MALDFPPGTPGATYTGPNGVIWSWDGAKWLAGTSANVYAPVQSPVFTGDPQAPQPAAGDADASIATTKFVTDAVATSLHDVGRNYLHNSVFRVNQRGTGPWTASGNYTADRWVQYINSDTVSTTVIGASDTDRTQIGDENVVFRLAVNITGNAAAASYTALSQSIEDVWRLSGKTVTLSFWAVASAALKLGVSFDQSFGTGGSPSATVAIAAQTVTLATSWARYSLTFVMPSAAGKTRGTNTNDCTRIYFWLSSGTASGPSAGNPGVQTGLFGFWGIQLEIGSVATPLEKLDPVTQLQQCQRFYQTGQLQASSYAIGAGNAVYFSSLPPVPLRSTTVVFAITGGANGNLGATSLTYNGYAITGTGIAAAAGATTMNTVYNVSADL